jgi:hypothetical protein
MVDRQSALRYRSVTLFHRLTAARTPSRHAGSRREKVFSNLVSSSLQFSGRLVSVEYWVVVIGLNTIFGLPAFSILSLIAWANSYHVAPPAPEA